MPGPAAGTNTAVLSARFSLTGKRGIQHMDAGGSPALQREPHLMKTPVCTDDNGRPKLIGYADIELDACAKIYHCPPKYKTTVTLKSGFGGELAGIDFEIRHARREDGGAERVIVAPDIRYAEHLPGWRVAA